jgi:hypothetical protein
MPRRLFRNLPSRDSLRTWAPRHKALRALAALAVACGAIVMLTARSTAQPAGDQAFRPVLSAEDIQKIRQGELRSTDTVARIQISNETRKSFCDKTGNNFDDFRALTFAQQAVQIVKLGNDELSSQVHINSDPQTMIDFRRLLTPIVTSCASNACHGGREAGNFVLIAPANDDAAVYTDFYLLERYSKRIKDSQDNGMFGGAVERRLIYRGHGDDSLLVNFGLPTVSARLGLEHPKVNDREITPMFRTRQDSRCRQMIDWMDKSLLTIEPDYKITDYVPPSTEPAATQPGNPANAPGG